VGKEVVLNLGFMAAHYLIAISHPSVITITEFALAYSKALRQKVRDAKLCVHF